MSVLQELQRKINELQSDIASLKTLSAAQVAKKIGSVANDLKVLDRQLNELQAGNGLDKRTQDGLKSQLQTLVNETEGICERLKKTAAPSAKPDAPLNGYLKKQGKKGLVKGWQRRYFRQNGNKLHYYMSKEDSVTSRGYIPLDEVSDVVKKDKLCFDLVTPERVYNLQAHDELEFEQWCIKVREWAEFFKHENLQKSSYEQEYESTRFEERKKNLQNDIAKQETKVTSIETEIAQTKAMIEASLREQDLIGQNFLKEFQEQVQQSEFEISKLYGEVFAQEELLQKEEERADQMLLAIANDTAKFISEKSKLQHIEDQIEMYSSQLNSQEFSIQVLSAAIDKEKRLYPKFKVDDNPKSTIFQANKNLYERQQWNKRLQEKNADILQAIKEIEHKHAAERAAQQETISSLQFLIQKYDLQQKEEFSSLVVSQGGDLGLIDEYKLLRERYFHSLLLLLKLQMQTTEGVSVDVRPEEVFDDFDLMPVEDWPKAIEELLARTESSKTPNV